MKVPIIAVSQKLLCGVIRTCMSPLQVALSVSFWFQIAKLTRTSRLWCIALLHVWKRELSLQALVTTWSLELKIERMEWKEERNYFLSLSNFFAHPFKKTPSSRADFYFHIFPETNLTMFFVIIKSLYAKFVPTLGITGCDRRGLRCRIGSLNIFKKHLLSGMSSSLTKLWPCLCGPVPSFGSSFESWSPVNSQSWNRWRLIMLRNIV